jgi:hypothetical protein
MMAVVSQALESSPTVIIKDFGWQYGTTELEAGAAGSTGGSGAAQPSPATGLGATATRKESAFIEGEIRPFRGDYRSAIVTINTLADRISRDPSVANVRVVKLPLNVNPSLSLSGNTLDNPEQTATAIAEFKLVIVLKPAS